MRKLFFANLKMIVRNKQNLFWSLAFPLMFTIIFGFFFGSETQSAGKVALINNSNTEISKNLEKALEESEVFKIQKENSEDEGRKSLENNEVSSVMIIPKDFGSLVPNSPTEVKVISDPANMQAVSVSSFVEMYLNQVNLKIQNARVIFSIKQESTVSGDFTYFDFVLIGLIGLALMNSSVQGIAISMSNYREDKILKRITTTPLPSWKFVASEVLSRLVLNAIQIALVLFVGIYFFNANLYGNILLLGLFSMVGALLFLSIGFAVASFSKTADAAQGMSVAITIPMMFLAGVFFPIDSLPDWMFQIVRFLPLAPLLEMLREIGIENISPFTNPFNIILVLVWIIVGLFISIRKFRLSEE